MGRRSTPLIRTLNWPRHGVHKAEKERGFGHVVVTSKIRIWKKPKDTPFPKILYKNVQLCPIVDALINDVSR